MPELDHKFVSLPLAMTGPVGRPVGEPPGGSSDTASVASAAMRCINSAGRLMWTGHPGSMRPSERGLSPGAISQSSRTRWSKVVAEAGTMVSPLRAGSIAAINPCVYRNLNPNVVVEWWNFRKGQPCKAEARGANPGLLLVASRS